MYFHNLSSIIRVESDDGHEAQKFAKAKFVVNFLWIVSHLHKLWNCVSRENAKSTDEEEEDEEALEDRMKTKVLLFQIHYQDSSEGKMVNT